MASLAAFLALGALPAHGQTPTSWPVPSPEPVALCPPATPGLINGRVSEKLSGLVVPYPSPLSISGAAVELLEYGLSTTTDANGCFAFELPSTGGLSLLSVRATAAGYGSFTLANFMTHADGVRLSIELEPGGVAKTLDFCHFETPPDTAARQLEYAVCAEEGKLTTGFGSSPVAAPPDTGSGSLASGGRGIPRWLMALLVAGGISGIAAVARVATLGRTR